MKSQGTGSSYLETYLGQLPSSRHLVRTKQHVSLKLWSFFSNRPREIPQQDNTYDCGIFTCQYARCLATTCKMIPKTEVPTYRLLMIQELYQKRLCPIPPPTIQPGQYYAVDYIKNYYFRRVIDKNDSFVQFKFLHRVDATTYH
mgnify:FL=1